MFVFVFVLIVLLLIWAFIEHLKSKKWAALDKIPGPKGIPILGNSLDVKTNAIDFADEMLNLSLKYDGLFKLKFPKFGHWVLTTNPKYIEQMLTSTVHIDKPNFYHLFDDWLGNGLGAQKGNAWKDQRKIFNSMFSTKLLEGFATEFDEINKEFIEGLKHRLNEPIDFLPLIEKNNMFHIFRTLISDNVKTSKMEEYVRNYRLARVISTDRFFSIKAFDFVFKFTRDYKRLKKALSDIYETLGRVIEDRKVGNNFRLQTFLDSLLDYNKANPENQLNRLHIHLDNFMFAAHDTTSAILSMGLAELSRNKDIQDELYNESVQIFGADPSAQLTLKQLESAKYLDMFCMELLRKYLGYPMIGRETCAPLKLGDVDIPIGTTVVMLLYAMHRSPKYYPDPLKFDPDRFSSENKALREDYAHIPFSRGPRNCVAQRYGLLIIKAGIISLVRNFILSKGHPDFEVKYGHAATLTVLNGILVKLETRK